MNNNCFHKLLTVFSNSICALHIRCPQNADTISASNLQTTNLRKVAIMFSGSLLKSENPTTDNTNRLSQEEILNESDKLERVKILKMSHVEPRVGFHHIILGKSIISTKLDVHTNEEFKIILNSVCLKKFPS